MPHCLRCNAEIDPAYKACPHCGEPVTDFVRRYSSEPIDGKYKLIGRLGTGGMGEVYKVHHNFLGADRVIKVIRSQISGSGDAHERFLREARVATRVQHPNVATLHDFSALPDGSHYMVWEFIDGENLAQVIRRRGVLPPRYAIRVTIEALLGLDAIHRAGIVHRDISPENLMITVDENGEEHVKIIDLGVAKFDDPEHAQTKTGIFVGKLRYAAPEQLGFLGEGERIDGRADLYSLAIVLYEMLTGRPPFEATSPHEYILHHSKETAMKTLVLPDDLPGGPALQQAIARALEPQRPKRFASARDFIAALTEIERSLPVTSPPFDAETTMRLTPPPTTPTPMPGPIPARNTLQRSTVRSEVSQPIAPVIDRAAPTVPSTPMPHAAPTIVDRSPAPRSQTKTSTLATLAIIIVILLGAIGGYLWLRPQGEPLAPPQTVSNAPKLAPAVPSTTSLNVVATPTESAAPTTTTTTTAPTATLTEVAPTPATTSSSVALSAPVEPAHVTPPKPKKPEPQPQPQPQPQPAKPADGEFSVPFDDQPAPSPVPRTYAANATYVEGREEGNDDAIASLRRSLQGVRRIAIEGNDVEGVTSAIRHAAGSKVTIVRRFDSPDAVINFDGTLARARLGAKRRSANATITRTGRVIFRYVLSAETYRVGDNPAEAFARVFADALE